MVTLIYYSQRMNAIDDLLELLAVQFLRRVHGK